MPRFRLTLAYDGTDYAGWQVQPGRKTVQDVLEQAIERITRQRVRVLASGRTDAGVHARGQVAAFSADTRLAPDELARALNAELPADVAVLDAAEVDPCFHPIRDAIAKRYRYLIHDGPVREVFARRYRWQVRARLDAGAMRRAACALQGTHDFSSFETSGAPRLSSVRSIHQIDVRRGEAPHADLVTIEIEADGFLYNMARAIVGTLVEVGRGAKAETWVAEVLHAADRRQAGPTAPPQGLFLLWVKYP
jgi:tRNA pseudouridine38-40 synthase